MLKIEDEQGQLYEEAKSKFADKALTYKVDCLVEVPDYDTDKDKINTAGIHFVLDKTCAWQYDKQCLMHGVLRRFFPNGQIESETSFDSGPLTNHDYWLAVMHGPCRRWAEDGSPIFDYNYYYGIKHGLQREWWATDRLYCEYTLEYGQRHGKSSYWYSNGQMMKQGIYVRDKLQGPYSEWYENGDIKEQANMNNGISRKYEKKARPGSNPAPAPPVDDSCCTII